MTCFFVSCYNDKEKINPLGRAIVVNRIFIGFKFLWKLQIKIAKKSDDKDLHSINLFFKYSIR